MEPLLSYLSLLFLFAIAGLVTLRAKFKNQHLKLPPGPWQLPVIGNIHQMAGLLLHHRFRDLSKTYGPLMHIKLGEVSMVIASSPEAAQEILKTHDLHFASRPLFPSVDLMSYNGKSLSFAPYGYYWKQIRKISVMELLSAKRVRSFRSIREEEVRNLIDSISSSSSSSSSSPNKLINLTEMLVKMINNITTTVAIGGKWEDQTAFLEVMFEVLKSVGGFNLADLFPSLSWLLGLRFGASKVESLHRKLDMIMEEIIQEHKGKKISNTDQEEVLREDLLDVLLRLQGEGGLQIELTSDCIKAIVLDLTVAGSETTSSMLVWVMSELIQNPQAMKRAQLEVRRALRGKTEVTESDISELNYLHMVIKETLRLHPPGPLLLPRECMKACQVLGYAIPEKTRVLVNIWAMLRDPSYWKDAEEFKPERFEGSPLDFKGTSFEFLPFGAGRRMCPGMSFGMANMELPLAQLLYYFDWELPHGLEAKDLDMSESFGLTVHKSSDLCLRAIPHILI